MRHLGDNTDAVRRLRPEFALGIQRSGNDKQFIERIRRVTGMELNDAKRVLRTERTHIENLAQQEAAVEHWRKTGVKPFKKWVCMFRNSRDSHMAMHEQTVPIDEDFILPSGQPISYPGDSKAGAAEVCNCQCQMEIVPGNTGADKGSNAVADMVEETPEEQERMFLESLNSNVNRGIIELTDETIRQLETAFSDGELTVGQRFVSPDPDNPQLCIFDGWVRGYRTQTIAGNGKERQIDEIDGLVSRWHGDPNEWRRCKRPAKVFVEENGDMIEGVCDFHWYEEPTAGIHKRKVKFNAETGE